MVFAEWLASNVICTWVCFWILHPPTVRPTLRLAKYSPPSISKLEPGLIWRGVDREIPLYGRLHVSASCVNTFTVSTLYWPLAQWSLFGSATARNGNQTSTGHLVTGHWYAQASIKADLELSTHNDSPLCVDCSTRLFEKRATSSPNPITMDTPERGLSAP